MSEPTMVFVNLHPYVEALYRTIERAIDEKKIPDLNIQPEDCILIVKDLLADVGDYNLYRRLNIGHINRVPQRISVMCQIDYARKVLAATPASTASILSMPKESMDGLFHTYVTEGEDGAYSFLNTCTSAFKKEVVAGLKELFPLYGVDINTVDEDNKLYPLVKYIQDMECFIEDIDVYMKAYEYICQYITTNCWTEWHIRDVGFNNYIIENHGDYRINYFNEHHNP